jgi:hypothetical protein
MGSMREYLEIVGHLGYNMGKPFLPNTYKVSISRYSNSIKNASSKGNIFYKYSYYTNF